MFFHGSEDLMENETLLTKSMFDKARWDKIKSNADAWWAGKLTRPLLQIRLHNAAATRQPSKIPCYSYQTFYDLSVPAVDIIDAWDYEFSTMRFMGDAFPNFLVNFGPGVIAAFLGARLENGNETVWFYPRQKQEIDELELMYGKDPLWFNRMKDITAAAIERWQGSVQIDMTDLGGNLDILSSFRPNEGLLLDIYDHPQAVKKVTWLAHELWWRYFHEYSAMLKPVNQGYTAWCPIFSRTPYYILQCDFSYMIGPNMFDEFVKPELAASCGRLSNSFYHLDGRGQLPHLDSLLAVPDLKGIQWVPGAGVPEQRYWPEVYQKIHNAGKLIQIYDHDNFDNFELIADQLGTAKGIVLIADLDISQKNRAEKFLEKWNS
jgi:5-methyltetrahydrofolate--homocysteine methyltransferase